MTEETSLPEEYELQKDVRNPSEVAEFLRRLADGIEDGRVSYPHLGFQAEHAAVLDRRVGQVAQVPTGNSVFFLHCRFESSRNG